MTLDWSIDSSSGGASRPIIGTTHSPECEPRGHVLIAHGFKGYKDYGFIPWLAQHAARCGFVAHRFNFSHGGMVHGHGPFDEEVFRDDTWNRQVEDVLSLLDAVRKGALPGSPGPVGLVGHSRGGVTSLLAAGRHAGTDSLAGLRCVLSLAAPSECLSMDPGQQGTLLERGELPSPSGRTGQELLVGRTFLQEQLDDPEGHDLLRQVGRIDVPVQLVHGLEDDAVPVESVRKIASALPSVHGVHVLDGANHVFNTPNPFPVDAEPSDCLAEVGQILAAAMDAGFSR
ncbi:MAG: hypothetical protein P8I74_08870 [Phycisphaerales bacterium]|nr:hypothetical protein [Phycisphaerales bacterium]